MFDSGRPLIIGVDGGGTGCRAAVGTRVDGVLARASSGAANFTTDPDLALINVAKAVARAVAEIGAPEDALMSATAHIGLAGVMTTGDQQRIVENLPYGAASASDDRLTSVIGALGSKDGYLLSVGTGTIVAASIMNTFRFVGGWGFNISDQASGAWLGRAALEQVILCHDGMAAHSDLTRSLLSEFDGDANEVATFSMSATPGEFGNFAPSVIASAARSDPWGLKIVNKGATYLAEALAALSFQSGDTICLTGGVGPHYARYLGGEVTAHLTQPVGSALDGAFHLACQNSIKQSRSMR